MMVRYSLLFFFALIMMFVFVRCEREVPQELQVTQFVTYVEPITKAEIRVPATWVRQGIPGKNVFFSSSEGVAHRFLQYDAEGAAGARIGLIFFSVDTLHSLVSYLDSVQVFEDSQLYTQPEQTVLGGQPAYKWVYEAEYPDGPFYGEQYVATADSQLVTVLQLEVFGGFLPAVKPIFDTAVATIVLGRKPRPRPVIVDTVIVEREPFKPAETLRPYRTEHFQIPIPENFVATSQQKQNALLSVKFAGDGGPSDCTVEIDVFEAKKAKLEKIVEDNRAAYEDAGFKIVTVQSATIDGHPAKFFEYRYGKNIAGRAYFVLANGKLYRITLNWYIPERDLYYPVFQKMVRSVKLQ